MDSNFKLYKDRKGFKNTVGSYFNQPPSFTTFFTFSITISFKF